MDGVHPRSDPAERSASIRAVLFDWRGTLVTTLTEQQWVQESLRRLDRPAPEETVGGLAALLRGVEDELDGPGVDADADLHARTYRGVLAGLGLDDELVEALYAVEADPSLNLFAADVEETLLRLRALGLRTAVVSDVHVDIRPAFATAGLAGLVDVFTLSFEQGAQKPDPAMFVRTLTALGVAADEALMVGDRARPDGGAVDAGLVTLLLPTLAHTTERRLHRVLALCESESGHISHAR
jgi:FMN phosphatase YigB (HAD superfamily)